MTRARVKDIDQQVLEEQRAHGDVLVLSNLEDMYWGWEHTAKTFLAMLAALERQPTAQHFACLHDDVYVRCMHRDWRNACVCGILEDMASISAMPTRATSLWAMRKRTCQTTRHSTATG